MARRRRGGGRFWRWLGRGVAGLCALVLLSAAAVCGLIWASLPGGDVIADLATLSAPVAVDIDRDGIPRIRAASERDAAAALGLLHARERFLQMDLTRRATAGELAELAGRVALPLDRMMRTLGVRQSAQADLDAASPETRAVLDAYTAGVNAWLARRGRFVAAEYLLLGPPRPWTEVDCMLWSKAMGLFLSGNWRTELARAGLTGRMPTEQIRALWPPGGRTGHPEATLAPALGTTAARLAALLPRFPAPFTLPETASNEWAVDGAHSATGAPLLAGDPHLSLGLPGIWYLARIDLPDRSLVGATAPGVPMLVIGQNGSIAWSFTNTGADVQDLFVETPAGPDAYVTPEGPRPYTIRTEHIVVRNGPNETLRVRITRHGPVISDLVDPNGPVLAAAMANLIPGITAADGLRQLNQARSVAEAGLAAAAITAPVQNMLVADRRGIGLFVTGRVPVRRSGDGALPANGADGAADWIGWAEGDALPHIIAPASGRLVNANERVAPPDFPVFLGADWFADWRARRIRARLDATPRPDVSDFAAMQVDSVSLFARDTLPALLATPAEGRAAEVRDLLRGWDGTMRRDAPQPLIFEAWTQIAAARILAAAHAPQDAAAPGQELLAAALAPQGAALCGGNCTDLLAQSLLDATAELSASFGAAAADWRWGQAHRAQFPHPLLRFVPVLRDLAGAAIDSDGGDDTLLRAATAGRGFTAVHGAAYRGAYDLAAPDRSLFLVAPGQSGHFASTLARNFLQRWRDGGSVTIGARAAPGAVRLTLRPAP